VAESGVHLAETVRHGGVIIGWVVIAVMVTVQAVLAAQAYGALREQVDTNTKGINHLSVEYTKIDALSTQLSLMQQEQKYDEGLLRRIAQKVGAQTGAP